MPAVSVVSICFENPVDLERTLRSLLGIDRDLVETIVVDGSRSDRCAAVASRFPVDVYIHGLDRGKYDAMNKGVGAACGRSVIAINSGDEICSVDTFEAVIDANDDLLDSHVIYGDVIHVIGGAHIPAAAPAVGDREIRLGIFPSHQSIFLPRAFCLHHPYDANKTYSADTELLAKAFRSLPQKRIPEVISRFHFGGVTSSAGTWPAVLRQYREFVSVRALTPGERIRSALQLFGRKLYHDLRGAGKLTELQRRRAIARAAACGRTIIRQEPAASESSPGGHWQPAAGAGRRQSRRRSSAAK